MNTNFETVLWAHYLSLYVCTITHNTHTQAYRWQRSHETMTKVYKDKPIRHQGKGFSANLENSQCVGIV